MKDTKILKEFAKGRRLPHYRYIGKADSIWMDYIKTVCNKTPESNEYSYANRQDVELDFETYKDFLASYIQKNVFDKIIIDRCMEQFDNVTNLRFAILKEGDTVPEHLDSPKTLRMICMIEGSHIFKFEGDVECTMNEGDIYFVNGCYRHSVVNTTKGDRIALLAKMEYNTHNENIINELL